MKLSLDFSTMGELHYSQGISADYCTVLKHDIQGNIRVSPEDTDVEIAYETG